MAEPSSAAGGTRRPWLTFVPLAVFAALAAMFLVQLLSGRDGSVVPSVLIGRPAPATALPALEGVGVPGLSSADFAGKVTLLNVWASWCVPCREEHPLLLRLGEDRRIRLAGLNYKDRPENARRFLGDIDNPFAAIGVDERGREAIEWGVYGVPETFLIGRDGTVLYKHVGQITADTLEKELMPRIEKALAVEGGG